MSRYVDLKKAIFQIVVVVLLGLSSTAWSHADSAEVKKSKNQRDAEKTVLKPLLVRVTGYGAYEKSEDMISESKRLMALRASKLDAFRALAERIYGTGITGSSTVQDFVLKHDGFATVVDTVIRGARVVSVTENKGAGFETVLELLLPGNFQDCLTKVNNFRNGSDCLRPITSSNAHKASTRQVSKRNTIDSIYYLQ